MRARSVQISLPSDLLDEVDRQPEAKQLGRSAMIQRALRAYLALAREREIDGAYTRGYRGKAARVSTEFGPLMRGQKWPEK